MLMIAKVMHSTPILHSHTERVDQNDATRELVLVQIRRVRCVLLLKSTKRILAVSNTWKTWGEGS